MSDSVCPQCGQCGVRLAPGANFCASCGAPVLPSSLPLLEQMKQLASRLNAGLSEKKGVWTLTRLVAERKAFLSRKRLEYIATFRIDDGAREIRFTEMLKESGSGLSSGSDMDDLSPGFGFKASSFKSGMGGREGHIEEQSSLFGSQYQYSFDFKAIRVQVEALARESGYTCLYQITPIGL